MPPRPGSKLSAYQLSVKAFRTTISVSIPSSSSISDLKQHVYNALSAFPAAGEIPKLEGTESFELCKALRVGSGKKSKLSGEYSVLGEGEEVKTVLSNWEMVFIRFRDPESGELNPVKVQLPQLREDDDEEEEPEQDEEMADAAPGQPRRTLKRKEIPV